MKILTNIGIGLLIGLLVFGFAVLIGKMIAFGGEHDDDYYDEP